MSNKCITNPNWIIGTEKSRKVQKQNYISRINKYNQEPKLCSYCSKPLPYDKRINKYCNSTCAGFAQKPRKHTEETKRKISESVRKLPNYSRKHSKNNNHNYNRRTKMNIYYYECLVCKKLWISRYIDSRKTCSDECKNKYLSKIAKKNLLLKGNKNKNSRWYSSPIAGDVFLESSWEQILAEDLDKNNIKWYRPNIPFYWLDKDEKLKRYYPDFYLIDYDLYIDPKNPYLATLDQYKIDFVRNKYNLKLLIITNEKDLNFNYVLTNM